MAKDSSERGERGDPQKRRKPATIDLPAEEIVRKPSPAASPPPGSASAGTVKPASAAPGMGPASAATAASAADLAQPGAKPAADERKDRPAAGAPAEPPAGAAAAGPRPVETSGPGASPGRDSAAAAAGAKAGTRAADRLPDARGRQAFLPLLVAAVLGAALVAVVVVLLARGGILLPRDSEAAGLAADVTALRSEVADLRSRVEALGASDATAPLREEVEGLRQAVAALQDREPVAAPDGAALADLQSRVTALSDDVAALRTAAPADSAAASSEVATLRRDLGSLTERVEAAARAAADVTALRQQLDGLAARVGAAADEARVSALDTRLRTAEGRIDAAAALAPAVAADALAAAVESGRPFANELQALRTLGVDAATLDALAAKSDKGLPTLASLRSGFEAAIAGLPLSAPLPQGTGVMDRLVRSARNLVEVRPAHPTEGDNPEAVVTRIRAALDAGALGTALAEREKLPDPLKAATATWAEDAAARRDADDLVARLRDEALSRLKTER